MKSWDYESEMKRDTDSARKLKRLSVTNAAKMLGVSRVHLSSVIHGRRKSPRLLERYRALAESQPNATTR